MKIQSYHEIAFRFLMKGIKQKGIPIATDDDAAIVSAIEIKPELVKLGCYHMRSDYNLFSQDINGLTDLAVIDISEVKCRDGLMKMVGQKMIGKSIPMKYNRF